MFAFKFGLMWTCIITFVLVISIFTSITSGGGLAFIIPTIVLLIPFYLIGFFVLGIGIKEIIQNKNTEKYGRFIYGRVLDIVPTGSSVNGVPELKAIITAYIPSIGATSKFSEIIGIGNNPYSVGDFLVLKHYKNDVNIVQPAIEAKIPIDIREKLNSEIQVSKDKSYVIINGKRYNKKQSIDSKYDSAW